MGIVGVKAWVRWVGGKYQRYFFCLKVRRRRRRYSGGEERRPTEGVRKVGDERDDVEGQGSVDMYVGVARENEDDVVVENADLNVVRDAE